MRLILINQPPGIGEDWPVAEERLNDRGDFKFSIFSSQSEGHNLVLVNGQGQAISGAIWGTVGEILAYEDKGHHGYALADATSAYRENNLGHTWVELQHALRHSFFIKPRQGAPAYVIIIDDIQKNNTPQEYTWQILTDPANEFLPDDSGGTVRPVSSPEAGARMRIYMASAGPLEFSTGTYEPGDHRSPSSFPKFHAQTEAVNPRFIAVLAPLAPGTEEPDVVFLNDNGTARVAIGWPGHTDSIEWPSTEDESDYRHRPRPTFIPAADLEGFERWQIEHFTAAELDDPAISGADAAPSGAVPNLIRYAFGLSPWENATGYLPHLVSENGGIHLTYPNPESTSGVELQAERSLDLHIWEPLDAPAEAGVTTSSEKIAHPIEPDEHPRTFYRLRATRAPSN